MIHINEEISIAEREVTFIAIRSSGPGGQHANKVSTAIELRFDITHSSLPEDIKGRLLVMNDKRITGEGILILHCDTHRSQIKNKHEAIRRLKEIILKAAKPKKERKKTKPTQAAKTKRLESKKRRSEVKARRKKISF